MNDLKKYRFGYIDNYIDGNDYNYDDSFKPEIQFDYIQPIFSKIIDNGNSYKYIDDVPDILFDFDDMSNDVQPVFSKISNDNITEISRSDFLFSRIIIKNKVGIITIDLELFGIYVKYDHTSFKIVESNNQNTFGNSSTDDLIQKYTDFFSMFDPDNKLITYLLLTDTFNL